LTEYRRHFCAENDLDDVLSSCDSCSSAADSDGFWTAYNEWYDSLDARAKEEEDSAIENGCSLYDAS